MLRLLTRYGLRQSRDISKAVCLVMSGGYPCQPFSHAGTRKGDKDSRHLWPFMLRAIRNLRPKYALMENVAGHLSMGFGRVLGDLHESGYDAEWQVLSGRGFGSPDLRERVFIVAYPSGKGLSGCVFEKGLCGIPTPTPTQFGNRNINCGGWWRENRTNIRMGNGVPLRVSRKCVRLAGNAVKPIVAQKIGEMILRHEENI